MTPPTGRETTPGAMSLDEARTAALLDRRTTQLATRPPRASAGATRPAQAMIVWSVAESLFGLDVAVVAGVIPFTGCARVPTREPACLGVIGRTGRFYSVIDVGQLLGLASGGAERDRGPPRHLLLLRGAPPYLALAVDQVLGRFDLTGSGSTLELNGRLVAPFDVAERLSRLSS